MKGVIIEYNSETGRGIIYGNKKNVVFKRSEIKNKDIIPEPGMSVEYTEGMNKRGKYYACLITIVNNGKKNLSNKEYETLEGTTQVVYSVKQKPIFIKCGNDRIKLSNIKEYGITRTSELVGELPKVGYDFNGAVALPSKDIVTRSVECLYITTYQGHQHIYTEHDCSFSIYEKLEELDRYLCN